MRELRDAQRLAFEPQDGGRIGGERFSQDLDRHIAIEPRIAGAIHLAHAAGPERADDLVLTEAGAGRQRHDRYSMRSARRDVPSQLEARFLRADRCSAITCWCSDDSIDMRWYSK